MSGSKTATAKKPVKKAFISAHNTECKRIEDSPERLRQRLSDLGRPIFLESRVTTAKPLHQLVGEVLGAILLVALSLTLFPGSVLPWLLEDWVVLSLFDILVMLYLALLLRTLASGRVWRAYRQRLDTVGREELVLDPDAKQLVWSRTFTHRPECNQVKRLKVSQLLAVYRYSDQGADGDAARACSSLYLVRKYPFGRGPSLEFPLPFFPLCAVYPNNDQQGREMLTAVTQALTARTGMALGPPETTDTPEPAAP
ncbi:MAG: hypothetical protein ABWY06_21020 [Pseudomonas sp.]|uniref:hypothetical protein n=1 Tax=Pseudomonas sp. TaxID=306 RepID=UPI003398C493